MRVALIAPPFISVPPKVYGGTELFIAHLAEGLKKRSIDVVVYCNGQSTVAVEKRWLYEKAQWPIQGEVYANLKDINHTAWAVQDACSNCDIIHLNNLPGLVHARFIENTFVYTMHHPHDPGLSAFYSFYPDVYYVTISEFQKKRESMPHIRAIPHGIDLSHYKLQEHKQEYLSFIGRIAPIKGAHLAVEAAKKAGVPLKIAGEVQPVFVDYFERHVKPHIDGKFIEYVGEADLKAKNELLGNSMAMLFPIQWDEPFGLVMIEAMACGTPVLALPGGSVEEVVCNGVSGWVCSDVDELAQRARTARKDFVPSNVRAYVARHFSIDRMVEQYVQHYREILEASPAAIAASGDRAVA
ncbi:MAG: glycosyltransferase family 4 protein [Terriglobales bacterium]